MELNLQKIPLETHSHYNDTVILNFWNSTWIHDQLKARVNKLNQEVTARIKGKPKGWKPQNC